jgi:archaellum component FlaC
MADVENLVLEQLRHIPGAVDRIADDMRETKMRLGNVEQQIAGLYGMYATVSSRLDRVEARIERIENRLELADTH